MLKTFTFVKMQPGMTREAFFERWCRHTRDFDLKDHPEIRLNRLTMIEGESPYVGIAENHWDDQDALQRAARWYATEAGQAHWKDLESFMDAAHSPTVVVTHEAEVSEPGGIEVLATTSRGA